MSSTTTNAPLQAVHGVRTWLAASWLLQHALMATSFGAASWILATALPRGSRGFISNSKYHKSCSIWILPAWLGSFLLSLTSRAKGPQTAAILCTEQLKKQEWRCVLSPSSSHSGKTSSHDYNQVLNGGKCYWQLITLHIKMYVTVQTPFPPTASVFFTEEKVEIGNWKPCVSQWNLLLSTDFLKTFPLYVGLAEFLYFRKSN